MTDEDRLQDKLAKLAADVATVAEQGRLLKPLPDAGFLGAILQEIDETILARLLTFGTDTGASIALEVGNRRLLRLRHLSDASALQPHMGLVAQSISDADGAQAAALAAMLGDFLAEAETLHVSVSSLPRDNDATEIGSSAAYLAAAWRIGLYGDRSVDTMAALAPFIGYCQDISVAWIMAAREGLSDKHGQTDELERIQALVDADLSFYASVIREKLHDENSARCTIFGAGPASERCLLVLDTGEAKFFCLMSGAELPPVIAAWHQDT